MATKIGVVPNGSAVAVHAVRSRSARDPGTSSYRDKSSVGQFDIAGLVRNGVVTDIAVDGVTEDGAGIDAVVSGRVVGHDTARRNFRVDIGAEGPAFLPEAPATSGLRPGQAGVFQIKSMPRGDKATALSRDIALTGQTVVLVPADTTVRGGRDWLADRRAAVAHVLARRTAADGHPVGWILRTAARDAADEAIAAEASRLLSLWARCDGAGERPAGAIILPGPGPAERLLLDHPDCRMVLCADTATLTCLSATLRPRLPDVAVAEDGIAGDLVERVAALLDETVELPSGGRVTIEPTQALVAIDVDQGSCPDLARANLEAAEAIAKHLRLRNLAGTIVIDFPADRQRKALSGLRSRLEQFLAGDPRRINAMDGPSPLGLVQFARERRGRPLHDVLSKKDL